MGQFNATTDESLQKTSNLNATVQVFLKKYGKSGYQLAKANVVEDPRLKAPVKPILQYLIEECWPNIQHPALISLACEAVGGNPSVPDNVSAALVLLTGAADMHDDIVDKSKAKGALQTAYGKFEADLVLLAGDILLLKAWTLLSDACEEFPPDTRKAIMRLVENGFLELGTATAAERLFKGTLYLDPACYRKIIFVKGAVSEACAKIGGVIGNGSTAEIEALGDFGRTLGVLMTLRHEFKDMHNFSELRNRAKHEMLPLPLFYAFEDAQAKKKILALLKAKLNRKTAEQISIIALETDQVQKLVHEMHATAAECNRGSLRKIKSNREPFQLLLKLATDDL